MTLPKRNERKVNKRNGRFAEVELGEGQQPVALGREPCNPTPTADLETSMGCAMLVYVGSGVVREWEEQGPE